MESSGTNESVLFAHGDTAAFERIVHGYTQPVFRFIVRLVGNREEAEDLTQDVFLKMWKTAHRFDPMRSLRAWIFAIARNTAYDFLRKKKHVQMNILSLDGEELYADDALLPDAVFAVQETDEEIERALETLSIPYRTVVLLHVVEGLTFEEIALVVDAPMNTVKSQYRRALLSLKKELGPRVHQNGDDVRI